jgi:hypothetical protein
MKGKFKCDCGRTYTMTPQGKKKGTYKAQMNVPGAPAIPVPGPAPPRQRDGNSVRDWEVTVPAALSAITGGLVAAFVLVMGGPARIAAGSGICIGAVVWAVMLILFVISRYGTLRAMIWAAENYFNADLDGDGHEGDPGKDPEPPGRTVINGAPKRPRKWANLSADDKLEDRVAFAVEVYDRCEAGTNTGQKAFRGWGLPSRFRCNDAIHKALVLDLVQARIAIETSSGPELVDVDSVETLTHLVRRYTTIGV